MGRGTACFLPSRYQHARKEKLLDSEDICGFEHQRPISRESNVMEAITATLGHTIKVERFCPLKKEHGGKEGMFPWDG